MQKVPFKVHTDRHCILRVQTDAKKIAFTYCYPVVALCEDGKYLFGCIPRADLDVKVIKTPCANCREVLDHLSKYRSIMAKADSSLALGRTK